MTKFNPNIHHRRSIRLSSYDYSQKGLYFVTICCQERICRFGKIIDNELILNDIGKMVEKWYLEISNKFPDIYCDKYVIMPNHFHCILENTGDKGEPMCSPLHRVIQWFKTMTTNEYIKGVKNLGWESFDKRLWQRNYYEHIIRNQQSLIKISNYIENNPFFWNDDQLNPQ